jgi:hypothetical protein
LTIKLVVGQRNTASGTSSSYKHLATNEGELAVI